MVSLILARAPILEPRIHGTDRSNHRPNFDLLTALWWLFRSRFRTELNQLLFFLVLQCSNARWIQYSNLPGRDKLLWTPATGFFHLAEPWHTRREEEDG